MTTLVKIAVVVNGKIHNFTSISDPIKGNQINTPIGVITYKEVEMQYEYSDNLRSVRQFICIGEIKEEDNFIGVVQIKLFNGSSDEEIQDKVNDFLYNNRHTHEILDISVGVGNVMIKYKLRNKRNIFLSKENLKAYQEQV